jgi:hypothetical protein
MDLTLSRIVTCEGGFGEQEDSPKPFLGRRHTRRRLLAVTRRPVHGAPMSHCATPPGPWFATGHADEPPRQLQQKILLGPPPQSHAARFPPRPLNAGLEAAYLFGDVTFAMLPPFCFVLQHGLLFFSNPLPTKHLGTLAGGSSCTERASSLANVRRSHARFSSVPPRDVASRCSWRINRRCAYGPRHPRRSDWSGG